MTTGVAATSRSARESTAAATRSSTTPTKNTRRPSRSRSRSARRTRRGKDAGATLDDLREAVKTLDETERTARRVLGGSHPATAGMEKSLQNARTTLRVREAGFDSVREAWEAMTAGDSYDDAGL